MSIFTAERNWMSSEFFLDTAYAIALAVESDEHHQRAAEIAEQLLANQAPAAGNRKCAVEEALSGSRRRIARLT
jgi:predicted nucleic acid-binding protein